jgi:hypothetical protein
MTNHDLLLRASRAKEALADLMAMVSLTDGTDDLKGKAALLRMRAEELRVAAWLAA